MHVSVIKHTRTPCTHIHTKYVCCTVIHCAMLPYMVGRQTVYIQQASEACIHTHIQCCIITCGTCDPTNEYQKSSQGFLFGNCLLSTLMAMCDNHHTRTHSLKAHFQHYYYYIQLSIPATCYNGTLSNGCILLCLMSLIKQPLSYYDLFLFRRGP